MKDVVICYIEQKNGKYKKTKCVDGANFIYKRKTYNAPVKEKHEILDYANWAGRKQYAFYKEGHENPIPLSRDAKWKETTNHDQDVDMLVKVTRAALSEAGGADLKQNLTLGAVGLMLLFLFVERLFFG